MMDKKSSARNELEAMEAMFVSRPGYVVVARDLVEYADGTVVIATSEIAKFTSKRRAHEERDRLVAIDGDDTEYLALSEEGFDAVQKAERLTEMLPRLKQAIEADAADSAITQYRLATGAGLFEAIAVVLLVKEEHDDELLAAIDGAIADAVRQMEVKPGKFDASTT